MACCFSDAELCSLPVVGIAMADDETKAGKHERGRGSSSAHSSVSCAPVRDLAASTQHLIEQPTQKLADAFAAQAMDSVIEHALDGHRVFSELATKAVAHDLANL